MSYSDLLKDPRWQKKRLEILNRDDFKCKCCGDEKSTLHVHHQFYLSNHKPWDYEDSILLTLCEECHLCEELWKSDDGKFMEIMLTFGLTRCHINSFVLQLWSYLEDKQDKRKSLNELEKILMEKNG